MIAAVAVAVLDQPPTEAESTDEKGAALEGLPLCVISYFPFSDKQNKTSTWPPQHQQLVNPSEFTASQQPQTWVMPLGSLHGTRCQEGLGECRAWKLCCACRHTTSLSCPSGLFYCSEGGTRNIVYGSSLVVLKKGVMGEIDPTTKLHRP